MSECRIFTEEAQQAAIAPENIFNLSRGEARVLREQNARKAFLRLLSRGASGQ
jgi:hypothetical protein